VLTPSRRFTPNSSFGRQEPIRQTSSVAAQVLSNFGTREMSSKIVKALSGLLAVLVMLYAVAVNRDRLMKGAVSVKDWTYSLYDFAFAYAILPAIVIGALFAIAGGIYFTARYYRSCQREKNNRKTALVERIIEVIREATSRSGGIAEPSARDILMPPTKRTEADGKLWKEAAKFIIEEDARVRTETRIKDGKESKLWVWN